MSASYQSSKLRDFVGNSPPGFHCKNKIIMKIKDAFKEHYFYTKENLVKEINVNRTYPIIQINAALTQLINDKSEFLTDEYGRLGHLINIDRYYLFQPVEIENNNNNCFIISVQDK